MTYFLIISRNRSKFGHSDRKGNTTLTAERMAELHEIQDVGKLIKCFGIKQDEILYQMPPYELWP